MADLPPNISEFTTLTALVFAKLYPAFPVPVLLDKQAFAKAMGVPDADLNSLGSYTFQSGITFMSLWVHTIHWLSAEGFTRTSDPFQQEQLTLTLQGFRALNAVPPGLQQTIGTAVVEGGRAGDLSKIGGLVGGILGGFTKTIAGG